jgi:hypothetical protein
MHVEDRHRRDSHDFSDNIIRDVDIPWLLSVDLNNVARTIRPSFRVISVTPCRTDATRIAGGDAIVNENGWTYPKVMLLNTYLP